MTEMSRFLPGKTYEEEVEERQRRRTAGLQVRTQYDHTKQNHWQSQDEVRRWFYQMYHETLLWESSVSGPGTITYHNWLPSTEDQATMLKLTFG